MSFNYDHYLLSFQMCTSVVYKKTTVYLYKISQEKKALQIPEKKIKKTFVRYLFKIMV